MLSSYLGCSSCWRGDKKRNKGHFKDIVQIWAQWDWSCFQTISFEDAGPKRSKTRRTFLHFPGTVILVSNLHSVQDTKIHLKIFSYKTKRIEGGGKKIEAKKEVMVPACFQHARTRKVPEEWTPTQTCSDFLTDIRFMGDLLANSSP